MAVLVAMGAGSEGRVTRGDRGGEVMSADGRNRSPPRGELDWPMPAGSEDRLTSTGETKGRAAAAGERDRENGRGSKRSCGNESSVEVAARRCREVRDADEAMAVGDGTGEDQVIALAAACSANNTDDKTPGSKGDGSFGLECLRAILL